MGNSYTTANVTEQNPNSDINICTNNDSSEAKLYEIVLSEQNSLMSFVETLIDEYGSIYTSKLSKKLKEDLDTCINKKIDVNDNSKTLAYHLKLIREVSIGLKYAKLE